MKSDEKRRSGNRIDTSKKAFATIFYLLDRRNYNIVDRLIELQDKSRDKSSNIGEERKKERRYENRLIGLTETLQQAIDGARFLKVG